MHLLTVELGFNKMLINMCQLIKVIVDNANDLNAGSEELLATIEEISGQAQAINLSSQQIAVGTDGVSSTTEEVSQF